MNAAKEILPRRQRGVTIIEALVALLIMAFGMMALVGLQGNLRRAEDEANQRSEATKTAQLAMESLRDFSVMEAASAPAGDIAYDQIPIGVTTGTPTGVSGGSNAVYGLTTTVSTLPNNDPLNIEPPMKLVDVTLKWVDRANETQTVEFGSIIAAADPALSGSLTMAPVNNSSSPSTGRAASIPPSAVGVGSGLSAFKPLDSGSVAWIFNNLSGQIVGVCSNIPQTTPTSGLTSTLVSSCTNNANALLLSGYVRFSFATPPDPNNPSSQAVLPGLQLNVTSSGNPTPAYQCFDSIPSGNTTLAAYYCAVYPNASGIWSGQLTLSGIALGPGNDTVCAYNANVSAFSSAAQPLTYANVTTALTQQNLLVILNSQSCPAGTPVNIAAGQFSNTSTVQVQP